MTKSQLFLRKNSSTILTIVGAAGVVTTSVLTAKATPKALELIDNAKWEKGEQLTSLETVKVAWKPYIPAIISGVSTIACIFGANFLNKRTQASLMSAYALLDNSYREYRKKSKELHQDENINIDHEIIKSKFDKNMKLNDEKELFFDYQAMRYFESTLEEVEQAKAILNRKIFTDGFACLNDFYDILGISHVPYGYQLGWSTVTSDKVYGDSALDFEYETVEMDDGLTCKIITITYPPSLEYIL